ncbi:LamG-like jellyroll fold domain-containing protein [Streptacidiphilus sp. MAP12-20]|uniref:LamG-like jellyroll fold domain-containing protein n=1 Tax=Streptacidiphilus sp. MAP12-20 TaxID=3156299 RepID=UPI003517F36C
MTPAFADASTPLPDPSPTASPAPADPSTPTGPIPTALAQAAATGQPVTVTAATTQTHQLVANPDGTLSSTDNPLPVRVQKNGAWTPVDGTLGKNSDGSYSPAATPSGVTLSGGGTGPLATLTDPAGHQLSYSLPFTLPAPTVSGSTALYPSVLPGVDLSASVTNQGGFSDVLVVHDATAAANPALKSLTLAASTQGLTLGTDTAGDLTAKAADGSLSFAAPKPVMWDSSTTASGSASTLSAPSSPSPSPSPSGGTTSDGSAATSSAAGPGSSAKVDPVAMAVTPTAVTLTPNATLLGGSGTIYPLYIDPYTNPITSATGGYDEVYSSSTCSGSPQWDTPQTSGEGVGYQQWGGSCGNGLERSLYQVPLGGIPSTAVVQSSQITAPDTYAASWNCSQNQPVTLHTTGSINSGTDWNNQPGLDDANYAPVATTVASGSNSNSSCSNKDAVFTVTSQVQKLVKAGVTSWTIGLFGDESQTSGNVNYLRFSTALSITTTFDVPPDLPTNPRTAPNSVNPADAACNNGTVGWIGAAGANGVSFYADSKAEITGEHVGMNLDLWDNNGDNGSGGPKVLYNKLMNGNYPIGTALGSASVANPVTLQDGHQYGWGVQAVTNSSAHLTSAWVSECHFNLDTTPPATPTVTDSTAFPRIGGGAGTGTAGITAQLSLPVSAVDPLPAATCTLYPVSGTTNGCSASGVDHFLWKLDGQPTAADNNGSQNATAAGKDAAGDPQATATITAPVVNWGVHTLYIAAVDKAGNLSQVPASYTFYAPWNPNQKIMAGDLSGDGIPDLAAVTKTGDLNLIAGGSAPGTTPTLLSTAAQSPTKDSWANYYLAHRGTAFTGAVDDMYAYNHSTTGPGAGHMYVAENDLNVLNTSATKGGFTQGNNADVSKKACLTSDTTRCGTTVGYNATDWTGVKQLTAPGDLFQNGSSFVITAETVPGSTVQQLWLYQATSGPALINPILLGDGDWSRFTLIAPGIVGGTVNSAGATKGGTPTLWARDNSTGTLYTFPLTMNTSVGLMAGGTEQVPALIHAPTTVLQSKITPPGNLCLDDFGNGSADGNKVDIYTCNNSAAQVWTLQTDKTVRINGKCLDAANKGTANGTLVDLWTCNGGTNQQWTQGSTGSLVNVNSGTCLADPGANATLGTQLILWTCETGHAEQNWAGLTATGTLPTPTDPVVLPLTVPNGGTIASPGDVNGPITTANPNGNPDGNPDLYTIDAAGQLTEYPGAAPSGGVATFAAPLSLGTVTNTATNWWNLADGTGTTAVDSVTGTTSATLNGNATWNTDSALVTANPSLTTSNPTGTNLQLDGTTGYAATSGQIVTTSGSYTVSAWVKLNTGYDTAKYDTALCQRDTTGARCAFYLQYSPALHGWTFVSPNTDSASATAYPAAGNGNTPTAGQWTHLVGVFDATTGNMSLYINGRLAGTGNNPSPWNATGPFLIGGSDNGGTGSQADFPGQIADVHVYNTALPAADAAALGDNTPFAWLG